jgi:hypothetical protein
MPLTVSVRDGPSFTEKELKFTRPSPCINLFILSRGLHSYCDVPTYTIVSCYLQCYATGAFQPEVRHVVPIVPSYVSFDLLSPFVLMYVPV